MTLVVSAQGKDFVITSADSKGTFGDPNVELRTLQRQRLMYSGTGIYRETNKLDISET